MTDQLRDLLRAEGGKIDVSPPPINAIVTGGLRRSRIRRTQRLVVVAASVVVLAGGIAAADRWWADGAPDPSPDVATDSPSPSPTTEPNPEPEPELGGSLSVSGTGAGEEQFGAGSDKVIAATTERLGVPDVVFGPREYGRIPGQDGWYDDPNDSLSLSWKYPTMSATCWGQFCLVFGGKDAESLKLRGWELADFSRWADSDVTSKGSSVDVRLAGSGIGLGDTWKRLQRAYPEVEAAGGEGASLVVGNTPWPGTFDGAGEWRLSGQWDFNRPTYAPPGAR